MKPTLLYKLSLYQCMNIMYRIINYNMDGSELESLGVEKDLGVLVDSTLKFEQHINETVTKIK